MKPRTLDKNKLKFFDTKKTSQNWGKVKFKPKPYVSAIQPTAAEVNAKPWKHVRNDIMDDALEAQNASNLDMGSEEAKKFMKQREQNYRRNLIETKRKEPTKWEQFSDEEGSDSKKMRRMKKDYTKMSHDPTKLDADDRNFVRRKMTKAAIMMKGTNLNYAINDMKRNGVLRK